MDEKGLKSKSVSRVLYPTDKSEGSYHLSGTGFTTRLNQPTHPDPGTESRKNEPFIFVGAYLAFQLVRFTLLLTSPSARWAFTPPFHLFPLRQVALGSLFSVALSVPNYLGPSR
jgi:hypothetical protein